MSGTTKSLLALSVVIGVASLWILACCWPTIGPAIKRRRATKGWETHPCRLPKPGDAVKGQVWRCRCSRRWEFRGYEKSREVWRERTPELDLAEAEEKLRNLGKPIKETNQ